MSARQCDVLVIGGGLIGLATAFQLIKMQPGLRIRLIEKESSLAIHQSGRNSGVAHAGIYYQPGSLKARLCVEGKNALEAYCEEKNIRYQACGKVIVAANERESIRLESIYKRGCENNVPGLRLISQSELASLEPEVFGVKAIHSPRTAIVDYPGVAAAYAEDFVAAGGSVHLNSAFVSATEFNGSRTVTTTSDEFDAKLVINCAGLFADRVALNMGTDPRLRIIPFRGDFFDLVDEKSNLVKALVYPVPDPALPFLGVHLTPTVDGAVRAGPNAILATQREGYLPGDFSAGDVTDTLGYPGFWLFSARYVRPGLAEINRSLRKSVFVKSIQKLMPSLNDEDLIPSRSGVRAQAVDNKGRMVDDFRIEESPGAIHVLNAPSPAATSSFTIGKFVAGKAEQRVNVK